MRGVAQKNDFPYLPARLGALISNGRMLGMALVLGMVLVWESCVVAGRYLFQMQSTGSSLLAPGPQWYHS